MFLGLGSSRQSSSFPQLQPCDPSCAGLSGAAPAGEVENSPLSRVLCVEGWLETSLLKTPESDESLTEILAPPPSQAMTENQGEMVLLNSWAERPCFYIWNGCRCGP